MATFNGQIIVKKMLLNSLEAVISTIIFGGTVTLAPTT